MLGGRVLEASQVEYKPFGKTPLQREPVPFGRNPFQTRWENMPPGRRSRITCHTLISVCKKNG